MFIELCTIWRRAEDLDKDRYCQNGQTRPLLRKDVQRTNKKKTQGCTNPGRQVGRAATFLP